MKKEQIINTTKQISTLVVSTGVAMIVGNLTVLATPSTVTAVGKVVMGAGRLAMSYMIADKTAEYVEDKIDEFVNQMSDITKDEKPNEEATDE